MTITQQAALDRFALSRFPDEWAVLRRGIEKESLRVTPDGRLAQTEHPQALGSALTNPFITTDFSEALLEFITPTTESIDTCLDFLAAIHRFTLERLPDGELLWVYSMPCPIEPGEEIPLARYGSSNIGQLKTLYRRGLGHRYGRMMQTIAGIHYNFSMPDAFWPGFRQAIGDHRSDAEFRTHRYLHLIRNFHRYSWLLMYLFGASPVVGRQFVHGRPHQLQDYDASTLYLPHATCLRMGDLGYRSDAQGSLFICYNELDSYLESLATALKTSYGPYEQIGLYQDGELQQINTHLLQLENEFYSTVRPKRRTQRGERPIAALRRDGIEYIEVRALDLNPFLPLGIDAEQIRFLDAFLLYCLLDESPACHRAEYDEIASNIQAVVKTGRDPALQLKRTGESIGLRDWAQQLLDGIAHAATLLDTAQRTDRHSASLAVQRRKVNDPTLTPAGQVMALLQSRVYSYSPLVLELSRGHRAALLAGDGDAALQAALAQATQVSLEEQTAIEAADTEDFPSFVRAWNAL